MRKPSKAKTEALKLEQLRNVHKIQSLDGNWNYDPYMHGLANGLILALSIIEGKPAKFKSAPEKWLKDLPINRLTSTKKVNNL